MQETDEIGYFKILSFPLGTQRAYLNTVMGNPHLIFTASLLTQQACVYHFGWLVLLSFTLGFIKTFETYFLRYDTDIILLIILISNR